MIDKVTYRLSKKNYIPIKTDKKRIVIGNSFSVNMNHYLGWSNRYNGNFKRTSAYTIGLNGEVYEHFDPKYYSEIINNETFDKSTISILIENEGWLIKDLNDENRYITYIGNIYNRTETVFIKKWRGNKYWAPYNENQLNSLVLLINELCDKFDIPKIVTPHNTKINNGYTFDGILYKSNLNSYFTDVNPSWDFATFKNKIEING
ncbi:MAG: N-acetylmuramoyl-L-alanine amidase [Methanobacterium sp.]